MTKIKLYNTKTRTKEDFVPIDPANVRMYVCGPTVYDRAHIGNARPVVVFDTLFRLLRDVYPQVTYARNFTDVDDKINAKAAETGRLISDITDETINWYHEDMDALGALRPTHEPRATEYIEEMKSMIQQIIDNGCAYTVPSQIGHNRQSEYVMMDSKAAQEFTSPEHALFSVRDYDKNERCDRYGILSGRNLDEMRTGDRVGDTDYKRDPMDFVLWKPSTLDQPGWDSPWGRGRPGWHIECSAMSLDLLGAIFDIHGGGLDLQFPHHENEIAQSCCANPDGGFANVWMHNEMIQVEGKKMSKSLGNFFTVKDLLDKGIPGEVIRFVILSTHYRSPMDWTDRKVTEAKRILTRWREQTRGVNVGGIYKPFVDALADDLNTSKAISELHHLSTGGDVTTLLATAQMLGLLTPELGGWEDQNPLDGADISKLEDVTKDFDRLRSAAMETKDFSELDAFKKSVSDAGLTIKMSKTGVELKPNDNFDSKKLWEIA